MVPTAVPADGALGRTAGVLNRIEVEGEPIGRVAFAGRGRRRRHEQRGPRRPDRGRPSATPAPGRGCPPAGRRGRAASPDGPPRRRFFASTLPEQLVRDQVEIEAAKGGGFITAALPLDELRAGLTAAGVDATLYPVDDR